MTARATAPLAAILGAGLVLRLLLIGSEGFHNDVAAFEAWALTLRDNPPSQFFSKVSFSEYPPGYFVILWFVAKVYALLPGTAADNMHGWSTLRALVKLPAIAMDLVNAWVAYAIVRRYASQGIALAAAAALALNPVAIYVSAYWGQVDSVSWGFALVAVWCVLRSGDEPGKTLPRLTWAWLALAFSILIKPPAAVLVPLLLAYPFAASDAAARARRLAGTAAGIAAGLVLALSVALLFHPHGDVVGWLFGRYAFGSGIYPYNSANAFNLYALRQPFWQPDNVPLSIFGVPAGNLAVWGVALVLAAVALVVGRYVQRRDDRALLEGAMLCALAFFVLATRMHERYVYGAFLLAVSLIAFGRAGGWATAVLTVTTYLNLAYSLAYQTAMEAKLAGVDATDLWPAISHPAALANVGLFFWLGYRYLGAPERAAAPTAAAPQLGGGALAAKARAWFDPREGLAGMTRRDWLFAGLFTVGSFVLCVAWLQFPAEKIFDEIYYARAGEEYLRHADVNGLWSFEFTHPPLSKLLITLSMLAFGGLHGLGDTAVGWRFGNVVFGALTVGLVYVFAKRLTASALFASLAAGMLLLDGFHYVQSRIATPEITVAFFSLLTLYAFYRLWVGTQIARRVPLRSSRAALGALAATMALGVVAALIAWHVAPSLGPTRNGPDSIGAAQAVLAVWVLVLFWLAGRVLVVPRFGRGTETSYADGTRVLAGDGGVRLVTPQDENLSLPARAKPLRSRERELTRTVDADGTLTYATPAATATYRADGTAAVDGTPLSARDARVWWIALALSAALLADAKWNGLFTIATVWTVGAAVNAQRWLHRPAWFGNPFGAPVDVLFAAVVVVGGIVYIASYAPYFALGHGFVDVIGMQHAMYGYHASLGATHPYGSVWWQWPLMDRPILYYANYTHVTTPHGECCVSTIRALPNPIVWWAGLISVPAVAWLAWSERNKGYALLVTAYLFQWLPWIRSPRVAFEYHFYPNLAIIVLANAIVLQRIWNAAREPGDVRGRYAVGAYALAVVAAFVWFFPLISGWPITYEAFNARIWNQHWI